MELWLPIKDFPDYEISSNGLVRNIKTGRILKTSINTRGYEQVCLRRDKAQYTKRVHRLVADTFYDGDHDGLDVNHIDGNKTNNFIKNLEFCNRKRNIRHAIDNNLMKTNDFGHKRIRVKDLDTEIVYESLHECGRRLNIDPSLIRQYINGEIRTCKGHRIEKM